MSPDNGKEYAASKKRQLVLLCIGVGSLYWLIESAAHALIFNHGNFIYHLFPPVSPELWERFLTVCIITLALYARFALIRHKINEENLNLYQALINQSNDSIEVLDPETGYFLNVNKKTCADLGYSREELLSMKVFDIDPIVKPADFSKIMEDLRRAGGGIWNGVHLRKDGSTFPVEVSLKLVQLDRSYIVAVARDITERKKSEEALREKEHILSESQQIAHIGSWTYDMTGRFTWSDETYRIYGVSPNTFTLNAESFINLIHPDDQTAIQAWITACMADEKPGELEFRTILPDGSIRFIRGRGELKYNSENRPAYMSGTAQDITEHKQTRKILAETTQTLQSLFRASPVAIIVLNVSGEITMWSPSAEHLFGWKAEEVLGRLNPIVPEEKKDEYKSFLERILNGESFAGIEVKRLRKDGSYLDALLSTAPVYDQNGSITGIMGILTDITERKKIEERFFQITHDWEDTFNSITDMVTVHDKDYNIIHANKAAEKILNLPILDITPQKCYRFYHGTDRPPEGCPSCECINTGLPSTTELYEPHLEMFIEITAIPRFDSSNNIAGVIHVVRDISERKKLEDQLRQSQKLEAIGELASGIAHDFNNILTAIIGYANILKIKLKDDPLKINIDQILVSSEKGAHLTQSLLAFSRQQVSSPEPVDINELVRNMEKLLLSVISENIELKTVLTGELTVMADGIQIDQVLINLCTNARDAMPNGGRLIIETKKVGPSAGVFLHEKRGLPKLTDKGSEPSGEFAEISVSDTGIGMEEKIRDRIFEPFFTTKEIDKGTGLGLSIVYGIIKQHNGYIVCESEPGKGTSFKIYLPIINAEITGKEIEEIPHVTGTPHTILLAEDEFIVRKLTKQVLEEFGYKVIEAVDGEDAVNMFIANKDDVELLMFDVIMPGMSGKEAYDRIRKITPDIKMILTSGYPADFINKDEIIKEGIHFVSKPVSPARLLKKVNEVLSN
jgi:PAS domain S-box-containing protein